MRQVLTTLTAALAMMVAFLTLTPSHGQDVFAVPLENPSFTLGVDGSGVPLGWSRYGGGGKNQQLKIVDSADGGKALLIADGDPTVEIGVFQSFNLQGGETYQVTAKVRAVADASPAGAYLQFRFLPSQQLVQVDLAADSTVSFSEISVKGTAPPDTSQGVIYLYTHREPTPQVLVTDIKLISGVTPPPPPPPSPVPPQYDKLKDSCLEIRLTKDGRPNAAIVVPASGIYQTAAENIQDEIEKRSGVKVPIVCDDASETAVPIRGNLIVLGNRSTNKAINALYDLHYCLVDLKYPGPEGYVVRSLHNPFGDGHSAVIIGGSDAAGVDEGAKVLASILSKANAAKGEISLGWTMETKLGKEVKPPTDIKQFETWEASQGYGSIGYFGWCSISKHMAMYYMTGDERSAREVVRLSFPDAQALKDIEEIDGERIENKQDPLAGLYHYNAHMAILFWDLIEESPVFTDQERLKITNAFARQLNHRKGEGIYGLTRPPNGVSSRHGQWSAISLYCLGRYFNKYYPDPIWVHCVSAGQLAFQSLHQHAWVAGESDNLFWYNTGIAPILTYMVLTGDRKPLENGVLGELLRGQEILISGHVPDWALNSASLDLFHKAAYLTGDGRWITYRMRTPIDTNLLRLGQSFWPDATLQPNSPEDLKDRWQIQRLPRPAWTARGSGLPFDQSFYFGSYRSATDATGDFLLLDGYNGASRNPYHTFDILELRLAGRTILQGYHNQVLTSADGMVEPAVAMDAALLHCDVVGATAIAVGEVPRAAFCNWRRTLCQRTGSYALIVDDLTFRMDSQNMKVSTSWQVNRGLWHAQEEAVCVPPVDSSSNTAFELRCCDPQETSRAEAVTMNWNGSVKGGEHRIAFYLIGQTATESPSALTCIRCADNATALALPQPALGVVGKYEQVQGEFVILAEDHLFGQALTNAGIGGVVASSDAPVDLDWNFGSGVVNVVAAQPTTLRLSLQTSAELRVNGELAKGSDADGLYSILIPPGRHILTSASPASNTLARLATDLRQLLARGRTLRCETLATASSRATPTAAELPVAFTSQVGGKVAALIDVPAAEGTQLCIAQGNTIHVLAQDGREIRQLQTDGPIRVLRWWNEHGLLLVGCADEKLIAFDGTGRRTWVFTSQMDPAVYEAAKTYWFKSAPGHEGIHGLYTGLFDAGKSRCFVGSACTLEILDEHGTLVKRTPVFWGPCWKFLLVAGREGSQNLLVAQWPNGSDSLAIVSSTSLSDTGHGYDGVPSGHTYVGGWTAQNRTGLFYEDFDGDGEREVATAINGTWNRVTVYSQQGQPLYNAQFGPGQSSAPCAQMRDMDVADLDGNGTKEIIVGISTGLVVALDFQCQKLWSTRLPSPPLRLRCVKPHDMHHPWIVAGCEDGTVVALDSQGLLLRLGKSIGQPTHIEAIQTATGPLAIVGTDRGEIQGYRIAD